MSILLRFTRAACAASLMLFCAGASAQHWTLSLSWKLGACVGRDGAETCATAQPPSARLAADGTPIRLTAIALTPPRRDCETTPVPADALSGEIASYLAAPGTDAFQQRWTRDGRCTGYAPAGYAAELAAMARAVAATHLGRYLDEHDGKLVSLDALKDAQLHDFFVGADKAVQFLCTPDGRLAEIRFRLRDWSDLFVYRDKGGMLVATPGSQCGDEVRL
jgi:ribonuclease I